MKDRHRQAADLFIIDRRKAAMAFIAALFIVAGTEGVLGEQVIKNQHVARQAAKLQRQQADDRRGNIAAFKSSDAKLCKTVNGILARDRATIAAGPANLDRLLRLMEVDPVIRARLVAANRVTTAAELRRRKPLACSKLPSQTNVRP